MMTYSFLLQNLNAAAPQDVTDGDILAVAEGNPDALRALYEKTHRSIYAFALSIIKNTHDAEDILSETFLAIHRSASSYRPQGKPMAWILTITKNLALGQWRRRRETLPIEEGLYESDDAFSRIHRAEDRLVLQAALEELSDEERRIVMLRAVAGLKNREVADLLLLPLGTVLAKYHRALHKLKRRLEEGA